MSTRKKRHFGNRQRGWYEINKTHGLDGRMESEAWFMALRAMPDSEAAEVILTEHFGSLDDARRSYDSLDEPVATRFTAVAEIWQGDP